MVSPKSIRGLVRKGAKELQKPEGPTPTDFDQLKEQAGGARLGH
jgi:hypothetical protein